MPSRHYAISTRIIKGRIDVFLNEDKTVVFRDNGVGLKEEEVYRFLTVIGESSKRDTPDADDFIGRFGIGLLSCFVVTNEITWRVVRQWADNLFAGVAK